MAAPSPEPSLLSLWWAGGQLGQCEHPASASHASWDLSNLLRRVGLKPEGASLA